MKLMRKSVMKRPAAPILMFLTLLLAFSTLLLLSLSSRVSRESLEDLLISSYGGGALPWPLSWPLSHSSASLEGAEGRTILTHRVSDRSNVLI